MVNNSRRILSAIMSLIMVISMFAGLEISSFATVDILDYLTYEINNGEVTITDCDELISGDIVIPSEIQGYPVTKIGYEAFFFCDNITGVTISEGVEMIDDAAFSGSIGIKYVDIPDSVTTIGNNAFSMCDSLESIEIPANVSLIGKNAFMMCYGLKEITVDENNLYYSNDEYGVLFDKNKTVLMKYPSGRSDIEYTIPDSVEIIDDGAFSCSANLMNVFMGNNVTTIGTEAFYQCFSLDFIDIPEGVTHIGDYAFFVCEMLASVTIPDSVETIGDYAFHSCNFLEEVEIPASVKSIGTMAFGYYYDEDIWDDVILDGFVIAGVPGSAAEAYANENGLDFVDSGTGDNGGNSDDENDDEKSYNNMYYEINDGEVIIVGCNERISGDVVVPDAIEGYPVTKISQGAFSGQIRITSVTIPASVTAISSDITTGCENLTKIVVDKNNPKYSSDENGVLFNKDKTVLIQYPAGRSETEYTIPDSVKTIGDGAFATDKNLVEIKIPDSVISIGERAFESCESLKSIDIPDSVKTIGSTLFYYSLNLESVTLGKGITKISDYAFYCCYNLKDITISDNVTEIGDSAFDSCTSLTSITIPDSVTKLGFAVFYGCSALESVVIGKGVTKISESSFTLCEKLDDVKLADGIKSIEEGAFRDCPALKNITIPESIDEIGECALGYCYQENIDGDYGGLVKVEGFTVTGVPGSAAETYANENGIKFIAIKSEENTKPEDPTKPASNDLEVKNDSITVDEENNIASFEAGKSADEIAKMIKNDNFAIVDKDGNELDENSFVGTGSKIQIKDNNGNVLSEYVIMVRSDVDGNGEITASDARKALRSSAGIDDIDGVYEMAADSDENNELTASDARKILRKSAGLE